MTRRSEIGTKISDFASVFNTLPEISEPPRTTLEILHERTREKYWNRLLRYFLNPSVSHGFGSDFLRGFLELIEEQTDVVGLSDSALDGVEIESEIVSERGRPDILLYSEDDWFVCIELKVTAPETGKQTKAYAQSRSLGPLDVSNYTDNESQYVYLAKQTHEPPASEEFDRLYWTDVQAVMRELLDTARGKYPARSTAQLADFRDNIRDETMSDHPHDTQQDEYIKLYLEHTDAIDTVREAFEQMVARQIERWATQFREHYRPDSWDENWNCTSDKYGKIFKDEWRRDENGNIVTDWSDAVFRLEFRHRVRDEQSWKDGIVTFRTVIPKNSDDDYRDRCHEVFTDHLEELQTTARSTQIAIEGQSRTLTEATYSFDTADSPEGYYQALADAFDEHMVLVPLLTDTYEQAFREFV